MNATPSQLPELPDEPIITRKGKIACLPLAIRTELNRRLDDGWRGPQILAWLNAENPVREVLDKLWPGQPINLQNLSEWRRGGYIDWRRRCDKVEQLKELVEYAGKLGEAAGDRIAETCSTLAWDRIMVAVDQAETEDLLKLIKGMALLYRGDAARVRAEQGWRRLELEQRKLELRGLRTKLTLDNLPPEMEAQFKEWAKDKKVVDIMESDLSHDEKLERLNRVLFWKIEDDEGESADEAASGPPASQAKPGGRQIVPAGLQARDKTELPDAEVPDAGASGTPSSQIKADQAKTGMARNGFRRPGD